MPRGVYNRNKKEEAKTETISSTRDEFNKSKQEASDAVQGKEKEIKEDVLIKEESPVENVSREKTDIEISREQLKQVLDAGQEFYESPEGYIVIGEKGRGRVFCRQANGGKGMWINPRR